MMRVVDASLVVAAMVDHGVAGRWAESILNEGAVVAPQLILVEAANGLRRLESDGSLDRLEATSSHQDLQQLDVQLLPYEPFADRVWELRHNISAYDAWYVAIAELADAPLATLDARLARASGPRCEFLTP